MSTWVDKYVKKLRNEFYDEEEIMKIFQNLVTEFNEQLRKNNYASEAGYFHNSKEVYFPDCKVSYIIDNQRMYLEKKKRDGSLKLSELAIYNDLNGYSVVHIESADEVAYADKLDDAIEEAIIYFLLED